MLPQIVRILIRKPVLLLLTEKLLKNLSEEIQLLVVNQALTFSGMISLKGYLFEKGVSIKVANFILNSRRKKLFVRS